ncbi:MAG: S-layer homology domain-containing protein, partial [Alicyclobacillaceae bacterium]|nr:S-layer homology domain-containing protein [Alicyclobacillaceae bacterium]
MRESDTMRKRCGKAIRLLTATALMATMTAQSVAARAAGSTPLFSDVHPEDWFYQAVDDLAKRGIVVGAEGRFYPNNPVTRAEFTKMAVVAFGYHYTVLQGKEPKQVFASKEDAITYASQLDRAFVRDNYTGEVVWDNYPGESRAQLQEDSHYAHFADVPYGAWYWPFVEGAWAAKVVKGVWPGQFAPDAEIERQDMATLLMNALRLNGVDPGQDVLQPFGDRADLSPYAVTPVSMAVKLKIMTGDERQLLHPRDQATRAHAAAMIDQALQIPEGDLRMWQSKTVKQLEIVPSSLKVALGERRKVLALALREDGAMVPAEVNWRVNGSVGTVQGDQFVAASQAGTGSLVATMTTADGRTLVAKIPVTVVAATPVQVELTATPSNRVFPGNKVRIQVTLRDPAGQLVPGEVDLDVSVSDPTKGSMDVTRKAVTGGIGDLGTFTAGPEPGTVRIRAVVATDGWSGSGEITLNIVKVQNPVSGKGLWGTWVEWGTDGYDPDRIVQRAKETGARYIYLI